MHPMIMAAAHQFASSLVIGMRIVLRKLILFTMVGSIVLAEDNLEHCFFFERALKEVAPGVGFSAVHDGDKLIQLLESYLPDLLFLDLGMPCKNGVQCMKEIRAHRLNDSMPIVVFSITDDNQAIQAAYGYGANLYIVKPNEYSLLKSFLEKVLSMDWNDPKGVTDSHFTKNKYVPFTVS
jgi:DNA-binding response OmpR family regulator